MSLVIVVFDHLYFNPLRAWKSRQIILNDGYG